MKKSILITGAAGFIGSNLANEYVKKGRTPFGVDDMSNGHEEFLSPNCALYKMSFDDSTIINYIKDKQFDVVIHLAAKPRVSYSVEYPIETNDINVTRTLRLLDACKGNIERFVFASSSSVYGGADILPTQESYKKNPQSPYALQKSIIEDYLYQWNIHYGLDSACLRFFNVFGPHSLGTSPYATAIGAWLTSIKSNIPLRFDGDGSQSRDMCYVDNVVQACMLAAEYEGQLNAEVFNVACGESITNTEVYSYLKTRYPNVERLMAPPRAGDVMHTKADMADLIVP